MQISQFLSPFGWVFFRLRLEIRQFWISDQKPGYVLYSGDYTTIIISRISDEQISFSGKAEEFCCRSSLVPRPGWKLQTCWKSRRIHAAQEADEEERLEVDAMSSLANGFMGM